MHQNTGCRHNEAQPHMAAWLELTVLTCVLRLGKVQECGPFQGSKSRFFFFKAAGQNRLGQTGLRINSSFTGGLAILFPCGTMHTALHRHEGVQTPLAARLSVENAVVLCWIWQRKCH